MRNLFDSPQAFAPFFTDRIAIEAKRPARDIRGTYAACVFPGSDADPLSSVAMDSRTETVTVLLAKTGCDAWDETTPPQTGDRITLVDGRTFSVSRRDDTITDHYRLEAKLV